MGKIKQLPYDTNHEKQNREKFWKEQNRHTSNRGVISLDELKEKGIEISDNGAAIQEIEDRVDFELALNKLTPRQREVIQMRTDGYSYKEIAEKLGISEQIAKNYHQRAKKRLLLAKK